MYKKIVFQIITILTVFSIVLIESVCPFCIVAQANTNDYYTYSITDGKATITDCDVSISGNITIPSTLGGCPVTRIGEYAFFNCKALTSIIIPDSVSIIDYGAFNDCTSLASITIPNSITNIGPSAFNSCKALSDVYITDIAAWCNIVFGWGSSNPLSKAKNLYVNGELVTNLVIPNGVKIIRKNTFYNCTFLTSITIPDSVTSIGENAFYSCTQLNDIYLTDLSAWCNIDFFNEHSNPLSYGKNLYLKGELITNLVIPTGVIGINDYAFSYGKFASVTISNSVTNIGNYAFQGCTKLTSITIPSSVKHIGKRSFEHCLSLNKIYITDIAAWCNIKFDNIYSNPLFYEGDLYLNNKKVTNLLIPEGVTKIGFAAFICCNSITSITIPDSVTNIEEYAFYNCISIKRVDITDLEAWYKINFNYSYSNPMYYAGNLYLNNQLVTELKIPDTQTIVERQYYNYKCIEEIYLSKGLTAIRNDAFFNCSNIKNVYFGGTAKEWKEVQINSGNEYLKKANIYYNCTSVPGEIQSIELTSLPNKLQYVENIGGLKLGGGILTVYYEDNVTQELDLELLDKNTISGYDMSKTGCQVLTVNYKGYTTEFSITVFKNGDLNGDGNVNASDIVMSITNLLNNYTNSERYDVNHDGLFNILDFIYLKKKAVGIV